jgi:hypothetical protein
MKKTKITKLSTSFQVVKSISLYYDDDDDYDLLKLYIYFIEDIIGLGVVFLPLYIFKMEFQN